jgi:hypothetical protein
VLFSGSKERVEAELEICANKDEDDFEKRVVNADVQDMTVDSGGCAQGESLADLGWLSLERSMPTVARGESRQRSKLVKLPSDREVLPARE